MSASEKARASSMHRLFNPESLALVGATDKSGWSWSAFANLRNHGFDGSLYLVNPRGGLVHGEPAYGSLSEIPYPVDLAFVMVPTPVVLSILREGANLGIRNYVILTAGFAENGVEGEHHEAEVRSFARDAGLTVLGPNGNGFINAVSGATPYGLPIPVPLMHGSVGLVLQSGGLANSILTFAQARNVGISLLTSMGNEMSLSVTDVIEYLVDDPATRVIALFLEQVRHPEEFDRVVRRARRVGKPILALKVGSSVLGSETAHAHTGALVGDDAVIGAAFAALGVVRVRSLEDLIITAGLLATVGPLEGKRLGVVTPSGGASEIIADRAENERVELPRFAPETTARLREILPDFASVWNPLDVTGYLVVDRTLLGSALEIVAADPGIDAVLLLADLPRVEPPDPGPMVEIHSAIARRIRESPRPVIVMSNALTDITPFGRDLQQQTGYPYVVGGIEHGLSAIAAAASWSPEVFDRVTRLNPPDPVVWGNATGTWTEHDAAGFLTDNGIPSVPSLYVVDEDGAVRAADRFGYPVVLKASVEGVSHKSDAGGVRLGLACSADVRVAFGEMRSVLGLDTRADFAALVQPQRCGGVELLVGVIRDADWGLVLSVGLGGVWTEILRDTALRLLPVEEETVVEALNSLRGAGVLHGVRGSEPVDVQAVAAVVARIGWIAVGLGERLDSLEINPMLLRGSHIEALDALITWR